MEVDFWGVDGNRNFLPLSPKIYLHKFKYETNVKLFSIAIVCSTTKEWKWKLLLKETNLLDNRFYLDSFFQEKIQHFIIVCKFDAIPKSS